MDASSGPCDWDAIHHRGAENGIMRRLVLDARAYGCERVDGRTLDTAQTELGADAEGAIQEVRAELESIELGVHVVSPHEQRDAIIEHSLLEPRFLEPNSRRRDRREHALQVTDEWIGRRPGAADHGGE